MTHDNLNQEVLRALGFADVKLVTSMSLQLEPGKLPTATLTRLVSKDDIDQLATVVDVYRLRPDKVS